MRAKILETFKTQKGIIFAESALVFRETYTGRDIIAKNSRFEEGYADVRGYVPVEWWVMSVTSAKNELVKDGEGLTKLKLIDKSLVTLKDALKVAEQELMGSSAKRWPLTKLLDIGGEPKQTSFLKKEVPPIPPHLHAGEIVDGKVVPPGKREAYFFPPLDIEPYNKKMEKVITRLGIKTNISAEEFKGKLKNFGKDDSMYEIFQEHVVAPYEGWTIFEGILHAPGPWLTFEIQFPQDDFNLAAWRLGERIHDENERKEKYSSLVLKGLKGEEDFSDSLVDWSKTQIEDFKEKFHRPIKMLESGSWGRRYRIFFDSFYGEGWEIKSGNSLQLNKKDNPIAAIVWSGAGEVNSQLISAENGEKEFLIVPNTQIIIKNSGKKTLMIFTVEPLVE
ncbi:MAG: hypothetical protein HY513_05380 [Candidatus Aenigmarchaeota archaeon]|nr:hypothetical protein [Candidatus Aenigmarchaeota archaeon]